MILVCGSQDKGGVLEAFLNAQQLVVVLEPHTHLPVFSPQASIHAKHLMVVGEFKFLGPFERENGI